MTRRRLPFAAIAAGLAVFPALAAGSAEARAGAWLGECNDYATVSLVAEPWEQHTRTFYNGQVRVVMVDTDGEPACCSSWLVVIYPDREDELGGRACAMLGSGEGLGFAGVDVKAIRSTYSAATGLTLTVPVRRLREDDSGVDVSQVVLTLDLAAGRLTLRP
ncbi:MAG: hypothetical protein K1X35_10420 [Caulobacteraceae bacterium]|nr:hypothetical protein [Caulobacteraceae bacterium]